MRISRSGPVAKAVVALAGASLFMTACGAGGNGNGNGGDNGDGAAAEGDRTGITDTSIKIGTHKPLTGVASPGYAEIPLGAEAYFEFVNAQGGVNGREIEYIYRDDAYNPTQTSQVVNQLVLQDEVFAIMGGLGTPTHSAVVDFLNEEEVPDLFVATGSVEFGDAATYPWTFGWQPNYEVEGKVIGQYIAENFPDARIGLFLQGDDFGRDGAAGARQFIDDQVVSEVSYVPGNVDVAPQITQLQADGADFVLGFNVPSYTALSQLTALRLNYSPQWFYSNVGSDVTLVGQLLNRFSEGAVTDAGGLLDNIFTTGYIPTVEETDNPWTQLFQRVWDEHGEGGDLTNFKVYGMAQAYTMIAALQAAGEDLTREGLVEALQEHGSDFEGPWLAPLEYNADSHRGISGVSVVQLEGGQPVQRTGILTTSGGDSAIEEYDEDPDVPSESGLPDEAR